MILRRLPTMGCPPHFTDAKDYAERSECAGRDGRCHRPAVDRLGRQVVRAVPDHRGTRLRCAADRRRVPAGSGTHAFPRHDRPRDPTTHARAPGDPRRSLWLAARDGMGADLVDPFTGDPATAWSVADALVEYIGPALVGHGDLEFVIEALARIRARGTGAQRQVEVLRRDGPLSLRRWYADRITEERRGSHAPLRSPMTSGTRASTRAPGSHAPTSRARSRAGRFDATRARHGTSCRASSHASAARYAGVMPANSAAATPARTAWGHGLATVAADGTVLDTWFPTPAARGEADGGDPLSRPSTSALAGPDERRNVTVEAVDRRDRPRCARPAATPDAYLRLHLLSHLLVRPNTINLDGIFAHLPIVVWTNAGPVHPDDFDAAAAGAAARRASTPHGHRQVPAPARLRHARPGAHRRRLARAPRRPPRPRHHRDARGLRELQRGHARHLDGRGAHLAGRRRRRRQRHRRRRIDHGHALGRRHAARRDRRARAARRELGHRHLDRRRLASSRRGST